MSALKDLDPRGSGIQLAQTAKTHFWVPTPGELVSPVSGSAIVTVARAMGAAHIAKGGSAAFVARAGMDHDPRPLGLIEAPLPDRVWLTSAGKSTDLLYGSLFDRWPAADRLWRPIVDVLPREDGAAVFLYNAPAAAAGLRRLRPDLLGVVRLGNEVLRGWPPWRRRKLVRSTPVFACSRFIADRALPGAVSRGRILPLVNGVDTEMFRPAEHEVEPTVLFVGKVTPHKGPDLLIEAARLLFEEGLRFRLRIVGGPVLSARRGLTEFERCLRARADPLGDLAEFVPFVDRDRITSFYAAATVMVVPSIWDEPCSLTLSEGLAAGLACVASRRGGLPEVGGGAALYFDPPDVAALAACLRRLLTDADERNARAAAARARAEEISWDRQLARLTEWLAQWEPA
jgi:glycosyltransferase involved in cell wall biosynthesis